MPEDVDRYEDLDAPLARGTYDEEPEPTLDEELLSAAQAEFRESEILPGEPLS